ncbi:MAG: ABC transporter ATP-binding protein [Acidimicrobiia bacterium]|nr:ABC transporter ATP-binding protein [Acidimicrobiia bacterium]
MPEPLLALDAVSHRYGEREALSDVSLTVAAGEIVAIVGPSGSGKSTLLKIAAGLLTPSGGSARFSGDLISDVPSDLGVVFQDYGRSLFPWLRVGANVAFPLEHLADRAEREARVVDALQTVGLGGQEDSYPWELSGGMQQRVAIARALARRPRLLLMDEPFASVDAQTRADLEDLVLELHRSRDVTVMVVTHDIDEGVYLSDRVVVLTRGPARIAAVIETALPRPRHQDGTKGSSEFGRLRTEVYRKLER